jgi:hypothetical protein
MNEQEFYPIDRVNIPKVKGRRSRGKSRRPRLRASSSLRRRSDGKGVWQGLLGAARPYSTARSWFYLAGFPVVHGVIFWQDFVQWRTNQNGFANQPEKLPHNNGVSTAAASKLPPRAAQILLDA